MDGVVKSATPRATAAAFVLAVFALAGCSNAALATNTSTNPWPQPARPVVVAIGDSIMKGHGLNAAQAWPDLLAVENHWNLTNLACDGAGFGTAGDPNDCGTNFSGLVQQAVALHPSVILISGSSNDLGVDNDALNVDTDTVAQNLRAALPTATIVGISTVWNDTETPSQMGDINQQVSTAVLSVNGTFLDIGQPLAGHRAWLQDDDVHPTPQGQVQLAKVIAKAIRQAKLSL